METKYLASLGLKINTLRVQKGMSKESLAAMADTMPQRIESIEKGEIDPPATELLRIADALGTQLVDLASE